MSDEHWGDVVKERGLKIAALEAETFEPTDADIRDMAIFLRAAFNDIPYAKSADGFDNELLDRVRDKWIRAAVMVFMHPSYTPSVIAERKKAIGAKFTQLVADNALEILKMQVDQLPPAADHTAMSPATQARMEALEAEVTRLTAFIQGRQADRMSEAIPLAADYPPLPSRATSPIRQQIGMRLP